jgi:hypothetical protein
MKGDTMPTTEQPTRTEGFICMIYHYWGWGETAAEAVVRCRAACKGRESVAKGKRLVLQLPPGATDVWVDDMGGIRWTWAEGADRTGSTVTIEEPTKR